MPRKSEKPFVQSVYTREWHKTNYDNINFAMPKTMNLPKTLDIASQKAGISKAEYIRQAIIDRLHKDGFEVEAKAQTSISASSAALPDAAAFEEGEVHS